MTSSTASLLRVSGGATDLRVYQLGVSSLGRTETTLPSSFASSSLTRFGTISELTIGTLVNDNIGTTSFTQCATAYGEAYSLSQSTRSAYSVAGTHILYKATNSSGAFLIDFDATPAGGANSNCYIGAIAGTANAGCPMGFGRRTGSSSWSETMQLNSSGRVSIGNTNDSHTLDVSADVHIGSANVYRIAGTSVSSGTTLGSGVVHPSLTTFGTLKQMNVSDDQQRTTVSITNTLLDMDQNSLLDLTTNRKTGSTPYFFRCYNTSTLNSLALYNGNVENVHITYGATSDVRLKSNIEPARNYTEDFKRIQFRTHTMKSTNERHIGVVPQALEEIFPSLVDFIEDTKSVTYSIFNVIQGKVIQGKVIQGKVIQEPLSRIESLEARDS